MDALEAFDQSGEPFFVDRLGQLLAGESVHNTQAVDPGLESVCDLDDVVGCVRGTGIQLLILRVVGKNEMGELLHWEHGLEGQWDLDQLIGVVERVTLRIINQITELLHLDSVFLRLVDEL